MSSDEQQEAVDIVNALREVRLLSAKINGTVAFFNKSNLHAIMKENEKLAMQVRDIASNVSELRAKMNDISLTLDTTAKRFVSDRVEALTRKVNDASSALEIVGKRSADNLSAIRLLRRDVKRLSETKKDKKKKDNPK